MNMESPFGAPQITPNDPEHPGSRRDPEERPTSDTSEHTERSMDKTLADSFPTSDPPSTIPNPSGELAAESSTLAMDDMLAGLPAGTWAAISIDQQEIVGTGRTREEAEQKAREAGVGAVRLIEAPPDADAPLQAPDAA
jgi:hypothetical protein